MKKIILTAMVIFMTTGIGAGAWADAPSVKPGERLTRDQALQLRDQKKQKHQKKGKPARKVEGKAVKGALKVSPDPAKKNNL